jgi:hypothetical protein
MKVLGKTPFCWLFEYDDIKSKDYIIAMRKFASIKCCNEPIFRVGVKVTSEGIIDGFNIEFIELTSWGARTSTKDRLNKLRYDKNNV